jgi:hypothetical protein
MIVTGPCVYKYSAVDGSQPTNKDTTADSQLTTGATADVKPVNELTKPCTTTGYRFVGPVIAQNDPNPYITVCGGIWVISCDDCYRPLCI